MRRRSLSTVPLLVPLLLASFAGCVDPSMEPAVDLDPSTARNESASSTHRNEFLLDLPNPQSTTVSTGAEPVILADHLGKYLWIGDTSGISISDDGGATWTKSVDPFTTGCDGNPLAQDATGRLWTANTACATIQWASSDDFGKTWNPAPVPVVGYTIDAAPIADRPWIAARADGEASILYYDFGRTTGETCLRTKDGGTTWLDRGVAPLKMNAGNAVYDSKGQLYY
ncbi:MAG TPA: sialidase family protein, partial [Candidatus Thermoplasmatota archaeon]